MNIQISDFSYYYTSPGLSWGAFLKYTDDFHQETYDKNFQLELITDIDMDYFGESIIRGGLSQISKRYAQANIYHKVTL